MRIVTKKTRGWRLAAIRAGCLLFLSFLLAFPAARPAFAGDGSENRDGVVEWQVVSPDGLSGDGVTYTEYSLPFGCRISVYGNPTGQYYVFYEKIIFTDESYSVYAVEKNCGIVVLSRGGPVKDARLFATKEGKTCLDAFVDRGPSFYSLIDNGGAPWGVLDGALADAITTCAGSSQTEKTVYDVNYLYGKRVCEICGWDATFSVNRVVGAVFEVRNALYWVDYGQLPNSFFDADGYFSYRSGEVTLYRLDEETALAVREASDSMPISTEPIYEYDESIRNRNDGHSLTTVLFWISFILLGFVLPAVPLTVVLCLLRRKRNPLSRKWRWIAVCAGVWILLSAVLLFILGL